MGPNNRVEEFRCLHQQQVPLILVNIWDAAGCMIVQSSGASAIATSSASLAWANGYADGCDLPLDVLMSSVRNILRVSEVPFSVDIENGYSDSPDEVAKLVKNLVDMGVSGVNLEDGETASDLLNQKILAIRDICPKGSVFINARTDIYLRELVSSEHRLSESIKRLIRYISCGADGVFVPAVTALADMSKISSSINAPLNIMTSGNVSNFNDFIDAGVARISLGPATFLDAYSTLSENSGTLLKSQNKLHLSYDVLNSMFLTNS